MVTFQSHTQINVTQVIKISGTLYFIPYVTIMKQLLTMKVERGMALEDLRFLIKKLQTLDIKLYYTLIEQGSEITRVTDGRTRYATKICISQ